MCLQAMSGKKPLTGEDSFYTMNCTAYRKTKVRKKETRKKKEKKVVVFCFSCSYELNHIFVPLLKLMDTISCQLPPETMYSTQCPYSSHITGRSARTMNLS